MLKNVFFLGNVSQMVIPRQNSKTILIMNLYNFFTCETAYLKKTTEKMSISSN